MKVIILAGGFGTRLSEYTDNIPKPMVPINNKPILCHIMQIYAKYGHTNFYVALGYKGEVIKKFFEDFKSEWNINLIDTGVNTMTGGRIKRLKEYVGNETFMLTYGDGLSNININKLINFHRDHKKMVTISAVRPPARFGVIKFKNHHVTYFKEKSKLDEGWINGGFFVMEPKFLNLIKSDKTYLEREPLERASKKKQLIAYKHKSFWQCMDTKRDKDQLEEYFKKK